MADSTLIEWARHPVTGRGATWNIVTGCQIVSPGCTNCYAMKLAGTRLRNHPSRLGLTQDSKAGPVWTGETRFNEQWLTQPLQWKTPRGIFVAAHGDLFAEGVSDDQLDRIFAVMALCPQHVFFVLTKRPERMREYLRFDEAASNDEPHQPHQRILSAAYEILGNADRFSPTAMHLRELCEASDPPLPLPNFWLGVSVEDQTRADQRIPILLDTPAAIRFISAEPLLGPVDFYRTGAVMPLADHPWRNGPILQGIHWVISGGESGPNARPSHPDWFRTMRDQCAEAGVPFFFKQWGEWTPGENVDRGGTLRCAELFDERWHFAKQTESESQHTDREYEPDVYRVGKKAGGHLLDGVEHFSMPEARP